ncbi:MAG: 50S ribosomal protein L24 [Christensenellales bacterium]
MVKKLHVRKDDTVVVVSGKDKGKQGKVLRALPKEGKVVVEGVNVVARHTKPKGQGDPGGIIRSEAPIYASKVMLVCEKCNKATRISYKILPDDKKVRVCKKCAAELG